MSDVGCCTSPTLSRLFSCTPPSQRHLLACPFLVPPSAASSANILFSFLFLFPQQHQQKLQMPFLFVVFLSVCLSVCLRMEFVSNHYGWQRNSFLVFAEQRRAEKRSRIVVENYALLSENPTSPLSLPYFASFQSSPWRRVPNHAHEQSDIQTFREPLPHSSITHAHQCAFIAFIASHGALHSVTQSAQWRRRPQVQVITSDDDHRWFRWFPRSQMISRITDGFGGWDGTHPSLGLRCGQSSLRELELIASCSWRRM